MDDKIFNDLVNFTIKQACLPKKLQFLDRNTLLYKDLEVTGDDAFEFIEAFGNHFNVDISSFNLSSHFAGEGMNLFFGNEGKKDLSMMDLENAIILGALT
jgi:Protein of unknown function (DUF1493)